MDVLRTRETSEQATSIWRELDAWAQAFEPWQRFVLAHAVRLGKLTEFQINQAYTLFLQDNALAEMPNSPVEVPGAITGRPAADASTPIWLRRISNLRAINALPATAELNFLTVPHGDLRWEWDRQEWFRSHPVQRLFQPKAAPHSAEHI